MRDDMKQNRGYRFVKLPNIDMAVATMNALTGKYVMRGCDFLFFGKWRISLEHSVIFLFERKIMMADFGKLNEVGATYIWTKRRLGSSEGLAGFLWGEKTI